MELWIRTQSKQSLVKVNNVSINKQTEERYIIDSNDWILGRYKTKERALEVLDEIQQFINNEGCHFINHDVQSISLNTYKVYEMPKE